ncbi:MAG: purine-binding chemotaxis protein CheW [candidate division NC10 bacterium]|nr:purine-binding chemotaxis protein CheW [candidate division NC10 bacterium]
MSEPEGQALAPIDLERESDEAPEELRRLILFQACDEWFGLPIQWVREIQPLEGITRVPNAPAEILGILNLRGRVLTLFDLAGCLGIPPGTRPSTHAIVLDFADSELLVGLVAQQIAQVRGVPVSAVEPPPRDGSLGALEGVFELEGKVVGVLDLSRVFARALPEWGVAMQTRGAE